MIAIFDELTLTASEVEGWLEQWREAYLPAAQDRGLRLVGVWRGATRRADEVDVVIHWSLDTVEGFWAARTRAAADPAVTEFWAATDEIAVRRDRRVLQS